MSASVSRTRDIPAPYVARMTEMSLEELRRTALESPEVVALLADGKKISAIQLLMAKTGAKLSSAKTAVELLETGGTAAPAAPPVAAAPPAPTPPPPPPAQTAAGLTLPGQAVQPAQRPRVDTQPAPAGTAWLKDWKGRSHKTKKRVLNAVCQACGHAYQLSGDALNSLASEMGGFSKLHRGMEVAWSISTMGGSVSDKAGKQLQYSRSETELDKAFARRDHAWAATVCPACRSNEVLVEAPK